MFPNLLIPSVLVKWFTPTLTENKELLNELYIFTISFAKLRMHEFERVR